MGNSIRYQWMRTLAASALACGLAAVQGCGPSSSTGGAGSTPVPADAATTQTAAASGAMEIYLLPKIKGIPYFETCAQGAEEAAKELGVKVVYDGPTSGAADESAKMIEQWTLRGATAIAVSASDPAVLAAPMKAAMEKGIKVVTWDADTSPDSRDFFVNQASAQQIGEALTDTLASDIGGGDPKAATGKVAIITAHMTAANQNAWIEHIKARLASTYPNLQLVDLQPSDDDTNKALSIAKTMMQANPDLKGIFAISSQAFPGAAEAIKQAGKVGQVQVTGLSTPNDMKAFVKDGTVKSVVLWNTKDLGYLTVHVAHALATGKLKKGDTSIVAGRLGEKKIIDGNVMLGDILVFNKENIDQYDF